MNKAARWSSGPTVGQRIYAALLLIIGAALAWLGAELVAVGGSFYYIITGLVVLASGVLLWGGNRSGAWLYGLMLVYTLIWAFWEVGFDGWALAPRLIGPIILGLWLLTPWSKGRSVSVRNAHAGAVTAVSIIALGACTAVHLIGGPPVEAADVVQPAGDLADGDWPFYGRDQGGQRFSPLAQITPANVARLEPLWTFRTGFEEGEMRSAFEATPIKIGGSLYFCTQSSDIIALDSETGKLRWRFDANTDPEQVALAVCRGVSYYRDAAAVAGSVCAERIIGTSIDGRMFAVDARDGKLCQKFGDRGTVNLKKGFDQIDKGYYYVTSAPLVMRDKIVLGGFLPDNQKMGHTSGVIRAFDAVSGKLAWAFDVGRPSERGEPPEGTVYTQDTPNSWGPISGDDALGLVYLPTGNATPDWYGGQRRPFDDKYSSAILALDIETGDERWTFQTTHHDLWDYDVPSQPTLYDMPVGGGKRVPTLIQSTKRGEIFVLDRRTGRPITPVEERRVPQSDVPGERSASTQPFSVGMPSFAGPRLTEKMMWGITPIDQAWCRIAFRKSHYDGPMTPPMLGKPTLVSPGYQGGSDWGGVSIDPERDILVGTSSRLAIRAVLIPRADADKRGLLPMGQGEGDPGFAGPQAGTPYAIEIIPFLSPLDIPCQQPPYGMMSAVDMKTRKLIWNKPFGTARDSGPFNIPTMLPITMGVPNMGGSVVTRGGVTFIAATQERALRAFDTRTGKELWYARLPAGGQATPMTYMTRSGRQVVVLAAGGHKPIRSRSGDYVIAYALPR